MTAMLARRLLCRRQLWQTSCYRVVVRHTQSTASQLQESFTFDLRLPEIKTKEPQREPFAKNLFLGKFDYEFVYFPEPQTKERHTQFFEWLKPIELYLSECLANPANVKRDEVLAQMKELGVFRANVNEIYHGLDLTHTETTKLLEVLSCLPWLGFYFVKNHIMPIQLLNTLASDEQKAKYLPKIVNGEVVPTVCFTEANNGFNTDNIETEALLSDDGTHWVINGEKSFVPNGQDANLFLVFLQCGNSSGRGSSLSKALSICLIDGNSNGITLKDVNTLVGQQGCSVSTVIFEDTKTSDKYLLGQGGSGLKVLPDWMAPGNRHIAPQAVGILRSFVKLLTNHVLQRKHLNQNMHEYEAVQGMIGKIATKLYAMESILYMTTGMMDLFDKQDCALEKAMMEAFCANECVACIYDGLQIIGAHSYFRESPYIQIFEDALSYTLYDSYNIDSNTYIPLLGLQYTGKNLYKHVFKLRNPLMYPMFLIKFVLGQKSKLKLEIGDHMHPSLLIGARMLNECIANLANVVIILLDRHGLDISDRQMELRRLSEIATRTYALVSVLSRASRSYCIGLRNADQDRQLACSFTALTMERINVLSKEIIDGNWLNGDKLYENVAELTYNKKDYFAEHPLNRTY